MGQTDGKINCEKWTQCPLPCAALLCHWCSKALVLFVETYGTEKHNLSVNDLTNILKIEFDCRPGAIAKSLALREPKYQETAAYCHFGREPETRDGIKFFEWENSKDLG